MPHRSTRLILWLAAIPALALLWAMVTPQKPAVVACVDLERVFAGLDRHKAGEARLTELMKAEAAKRDAITAEMQSLQAEAENFKPDSSNFIETGRKLTDAAGRLKVFEEFLKRKMEFEQAQLVRGTYNAIKTALPDLCKAQGIDVVFMDDATPPFDRADPRPITQQISGRRMLWFNPQLDITDLLIKSMNESFAAGKTP
jgi:Skp family chaperone for outer membrane proteins